MEGFAAHMADNYGYNRGKTGGFSNWLKEERAELVKDFRSFHRRKTEAGDAEWYLGTMGYTKVPSKGFCMHMDSVYGLNEIMTRAWNEYLRRTRPEHVVRFNAVCKERGLNFENTADEDKNPKIGKKEDSGTARSEREEGRNDKEKEEQNKKDAEIEELRKKAAADKAEIDRLRAEKAGTGPETRYDEGYRSPGGRTKLFGSSPSSGGSSKEEDKGTLPCRTPFGGAKSEESGVSPAADSSEKTKGTTRAWANILSGLPKKENGEPMDPTSFARLVLKAGKIQTDVTPEELVSAAEDGALEMKAGVAAIDKDKGHAEEEGMGKKEKVARGKHAVELSSTELDILVRVTKVQKLRSTTMSSKRQAAQIMAEQIPVKQLQRYFTERYDIDKVAKMQALAEKQLFCTKLLNAILAEQVPLQADFVVLAAKCLKTKAFEDIIEPAKVQLIDAMVSRFSVEEFEQNGKRWEVKAKTKTVEDRAITAAKLLKAATS